MRRQSAPSSIRGDAKHKPHVRCKPTFGTSIDTVAPFRSWRCHLPANHVDSHHSSRSVAARRLATRTHSQRTIISIYFSSRCPRNHRAHLHNLNRAGKFIIMTPLASFFCIRCKPDLHHLCFASSDYINHGTSRHASRPSPQQSIIILLQQTTSYGSSSWSHSLRNKQQNSSLPVGKAPCASVTVRCHRHFVWYVLRILAYIPSLGRAVTHGKETQGQGAIPALKHESHHTVCQRRYSVQPPLIDVKTF